MFTGRQELAVDPMVATYRHNPGHSSYLCRFHSIFNTDFLCCCKLDSKSNELLVCQKKVESRTSD